MGTREPRFKDWPEPESQAKTLEFVWKSPPRKKTNRNPSLSPPNKEAMLRKSILQLPDWMKAQYEYLGKPAAEKHAVLLRHLENRFAVLEDQNEDHSEDNDSNEEADDDFRLDVDENSDSDEMNDNADDADSEMEESVQEDDDLNEVPDYNHDRVVIAEVTTLIRDRFKRYCLDYAPKHILPYLTSPQKVCIQLMELLIRKKAPMDTYPEAMLWHLKNSKILDPNERLKDTDKYIGRETLMKQLMKRYDMDNKKPKTKPLVLPYTGTKVDLVCYDAASQIESLLTDPRLQDDNYLFYNDDPTAPAPALSEMPILGDINTGIAYQKAVQKYKKDPNHVVLPIIMYIDEANTGQMKDMPIQALKFTLGIFNRDYRDKPQAWRVLGHVSSITKMISKARKRIRESRHLATSTTSFGAEEGLGGGDHSSGPSRDLHAMLDKILESYLELQGKGITWDLRYKGKTWEGLIFIPFVLFIKCDTKEGDLLCTKYTTYSGGVQCLCRYCCCPTEDSNNPEARYPFKTVPMIKRLVDQGETSALKSLAQQNCKNTFHKIRFSPANDRGIHGACPSEMLHAILLGIFLYLRNVFYEQIGPDSLAARTFDELSQLFGMYFARQSERNMPKCQFTNGIRESKLSASEYPGVLLVMASILHSAAGKSIFEKNNKMPPEKIDEWTYLLEIALVWYAFLCQPEINRNKMGMLARRNRLIMWLMKKTANRKEGMGLKLMKFHAITHITWDMQLFAVQLNVFTGPDESGHKISKVAAGMTQKNKLTFTFQTATRETKFHVADLAIEELINDNKPWDYYQRKASGDQMSVVTDEAKVIIGGTRVNIFKHEGKVSYSLGTGKESKKPITKKWNNQLIHFLYQLQEKLNHWRDLLKIRTEYYQKDGQIYRGHPNFRSTGEAWRDWVVVDWGGDVGKLPSQVWCFVILEGLPVSKKKQEKHKERLNHGHCRLQNGLYAVVERSAYIPRQVHWNQRPEMLFKRLEIEVSGQSRDFFLVNVDAFVEPCFVIPDFDSDDNRSYLHIASRSKWPKIFEDWMMIEEPAAYKVDPRGERFE